MTGEIKCTREGTGDRCINCLNVSFSWPNNELVRLHGAYELVNLYIIISFDESAPKQALRSFLKRPPLLGIQLGRVHFLLINSPDA